MIIQPPPFPITAAHLLLARKALRWTPAQASSETDVALPLWLDPYQARGTLRSNPHKTTMTVLTEDEAVQAAVILARHGIEFTADGIRAIPKKGGGTIPNPQQVLDALRLGVTCRTAQRAFYANRNQAALILAKQAEKAFDQAAREALAMAEALSPTEEAA